MAALNISGKIEDGHCDCPAGKVACNHLMGVLRTLALLQSKGFSQAPQQLSCTDLPQQWRVPRGDHIRGTSIQSVDWGSVRQGGLDTPTISRFYDSRVKPRNQEEQNAATKRFDQDVANLDSTAEFGAKTKFGMSSERAPLTYQQPLFPFGFEVRTSMYNENASSRLCAPCDYNFFADRESWAVPPCFKGNEILEIRPSLPPHTRQQAKGPRWHKERGLRLTAPNFGTAATRDLSRVPALRHGIAKEPLAVQRYGEVLQSLGHGATVSSCGPLVDPSTPWLGESPDRIVYDATEDHPHGILEVKCPNTLWDKTAKDLEGLVFCSEVDNISSTLRRSHAYYYQGNFVVFGDAYILIERIHFCPKEWSEVSMKLAGFYYNEFLPHLEMLN
ncbi:hypothetical protein HPB47_002451 [Ixodes persulcatus]|uniref:Uncharacterized protein n=1 Tax=Ixodes persulcatus TaxID=34615 RepID=A0AC60PLJ2_IXOPE|nr:hypothetical protein HPB47_002451 [Ixodes persulcatus]